jgi:hypothetical protein
MAMLRSLAFVFALPLNGHPAQTPQPQAQVTAEVPQVNDPHTEHPPDNTKPPESYWRKAIKPDILPVWIGGIAAMLASIAGLFTLGILKEQGRVGLLAAEAAKQSAQAVVDAERAWLVMGFVKTNNTDTGALSEFAFTCRNPGKTPATVKRIDMGYSVIKDPLDLPVPLREEDINPIKLPDRAFIVSTDSFPIRAELKPEEILFDKKGTGSLIVVFYGRVVYHDVFNSQEPRETRWCYSYDPTNDTLVRTGPDEYNNHT